MSWCSSWINQSKVNKAFCESNNIMFIDTSYNQMEVLEAFVNNVKHSIQDKT